jgi:hypothetical protein
MSTQSPADQNVSAGRMETTQTVFHEHQHGLEPGSFTAEKLVSILQIIFLEDATWD